MKEQVNEGRKVAKYQRTLVPAQPLEDNTPLPAENYLLTTDDENIFVSDFLFSLAYLTALFYLIFEGVYYIFYQ